MTWRSFHSPNHGWNMYWMSPVWHLLFGRRSLPDADVCIPMSLGSSPGVSKCHGDFQCCSVQSQFNHSRREIWETTGSCPLNWGSDRQKTGPVVGCKKWFPMPKDWIRIPHFLALRAFVLYPFHSSSFRPSNERSEACSAVFSRHHFKTYRPGTGYHSLSKREAHPVPAVPAVPLSKFHCQSEWI